MSDLYEVIISKRGSYMPYLVMEEDTAVVCFFIKIINLKIKKSFNFGNFLLKVRFYTKIILIIGLYVYFIFNIASFVQIIHSKYGDGFYKICVIPLISMLFIDIFVTTNIMLVFATLIMFLYGKDIYGKRNSRIKSMIFYALVPIDAQIEHKSIIGFTDIYDLLK